MLPEYPKFKDFEIDDLKKINLNHNICELAPANLVLWKEFDHPQITLINNNACILISAPNEPPFFLEPIGSHKLIETIKTCLAHSKRLSRISESLINQLPVQEFKIKCLRNQFDYVYLTKKLAELKGRKLDGKRNHIKKFKKRHSDYQFVPLSKESEKDCLKLFENWFAIKKSSRYFPKLAHDSQKQAVLNAFKHFRQLKLQGAGLFVDQKMIGFILGSPLNYETINIHFMYGNPGIQGTTQILLFEACNKIFNHYKYINLEQDLGIPGIRKAKLSYYPEKIEKKYEITP